MKFIRSHINTFYRFATCGFVLSWLLTAIALPVMISWIADSHSIYSVFNAEEGCFELVVDHHENTDDFHFMDESNNAHSFHTSCCYDDLALTFKKQKADFNLPLSYDNEVIECNLHSERILRPVTFQEQPLPPPATHQELRITRLLI